MTAARFDLGCSPVVFDAERYAILTRRGHRLQSLLDGTAEPRDLAERYFIRCIRDNADYDSHQCLEAEAWRQMIERRAFERLNPPLAPGLTWVRPDELQPGIALMSDPTNPLLVTRGLGVEHRDLYGPRHDYRLAPQFAWRRADAGWWRQVLNLGTGLLEEFSPKSPPVQEALDEPPREMLFVWQESPDDELLISDADTGETLHIPPNHVAHNATWRVHPYELLRVQFWAGQPVWVWGPV
jgi:hypothetical protein